MHTGSLLASLPGSAVVSWHQVEGCLRTWTLIIDRHPVIEAAPSLTVIADALRELANALEREHDAERDRASTLG